MLLELARMFPEAPIYTLLYDKEKMSQWFEPERVKVSFLQKFPRFLRRNHKLLLPLMIVAPETFDLRDFDLVISSSSAYAKGVITRPKTIHINYCHNPARFIWDYSFEYLKEQELGLISGAISRIFFSYFRLWDRSASKRVDYFIANSQSTARRIRKYYRRDSRIIFPPCRIPQNGFNVCEKNLQDMGAVLPNDFFLIISQLAPYKKIDAAVEAFNKLGLPLIVIGDGPQKKYLQKIAKSNVKIMGWLDDKETFQYLRGCQALIFSGEDDFGIAPVEAMGFGKPVLALNRGGALETVIPGKTGEFFDSPTPEVIAEGVRRLRENMPEYDPMEIHNHVKQFSAERFREEIKQFIGEKYRLAEQENNAQNHCDSV
ncbi:MAG: hypothetical protein UV67_C0004G0001 [Parcubacteria group bacterium GW2011_GWC1_43_12]|nr:MAG: Glycosyl transferase, group 1 [Parcubacteria group bacterium GW2011_GWB1_42_6]KKS92407.1 MAG: hypothetical protein UV67_C0004G0001 [Parcubacteria group bacterium GW2011_GWC1_43_12]